MARYHALTITLNVLCGVVVAAAAAASNAASEPDIFQPCVFPEFEQAVQRMSKVLTFQTVSDPEVAQHLVDPEQFRALDAYLAQAYPKVGAAAACRKEPGCCPTLNSESLSPSRRLSQMLCCLQVWERLQVEKLGDGAHSYLITWRGSRAELRPALFISHVDVVPVSPGTEQDWTYPPFSGAVADGYIWGGCAVSCVYYVVAAACVPLFKERPEGCVQQLCHP